MIILTGRLHGQKIPFKPNSHLRPTPDKARQAIFNMLQGGLEEKNVLDLFSGTGALGLEALSNGAARVTFVEKDQKQCERIEETLNTFQLSEQAEVLNQDCVQAIRHFSVKGIFFDFIFMDPPYDSPMGEESLRVLSVSNCLHEETLVFFECRKDKDPQKTIGRLKLAQVKKYGDTFIIIYRVD